MRGEPPAKAATQASDASWRFFPPETARRQRLTIEDRVRSERSDELETGERGIPNPFRAAKSKCRSQLRSV